MTSEKEALGRPEGIPEEKKKEQKEHRRPTLNELRILTVLTGNVQQHHRIVNIPLENTSKTSRDKD